MNGVEEAVESAVILDALDRDGLDLLRRQKCKVDSIDLGRYGLRDIHLGDRPELWPLTSQVQQEAMVMELNANLASYLVCNFFLGGGVRQNLSAFLLPWASPKTVQCRPTPSIELCVPPHDRLFSGFSISELFLFYSRALLSFKPLNRSGLHSSRRFLF